MKQPNSEIVIPDVQLLPSGDDSELHIKLGAINLRINLTMSEFVKLMRGETIYPKAKFRPIVSNASGFKQQGKIITLDADTLDMPTLDEQGHYLPAVDRLAKGPQSDPKT